MNRKHAWIRTIALVALILALGCGGGGGGGGENQDPPSDPPPEDGQNDDFTAVTLVIGPVTGFGSIWVNGVEFETGEAEFRIGDRPGHERDLRVGQVVEVRGHLGDGGRGRATRVRFEHELRGPVAGVDADAGTCEILGQTVVVGEETVFGPAIEPAALAGIPIGDLLGVSGFRDDRGRILATRVERSRGGAGFEVHGHIGRLSGTARTLSIHGLVVDVSGATIEGFGEGGPAVGDPVEVEGARLSDAGELVATRLEHERRDRAGHDGKVMGVVTRYGSPTDFDVNGRRVTLTDHTRYPAGDAAGLRPGARVLIDGRFDGEGRLVARDVDIESDRPLRIEGAVESVSPDSRTLTVLGIRVRISDRTWLEDRSRAAVDRFSPADLSPGDFVEVCGPAAPDDSGAVTASRLTRVDARDVSLLRGFAATLDRPRFSILGVTVDSTAGTTFRGSAGGFFADAAGRLVTVRGTWGGRVLSATEVSWPGHDGRPAGEHGPRHDRDRK